MGTHAGEAASSRQRYSEMKIGPLHSSILNYVPWLAFLASLSVYWLTVDPGASYWDCPEYLIGALRLEIGHPPGNPGWMLVHRFASSFFSDPAVQVRVVNMMSGLFTALAVMLLCSVSITLMRWMWPCRGSDRWRLVAIALSSLSGSLCFAWSDSAWYSAVEAEVYAMSLFLSALTVWMALKWAFALAYGAACRWLVALAYVMGFSIGVHQLNLLAIPAIALIMVFRPRRVRAAGWGRATVAFLAGCACVLFILKGLMPGAVALAGKADLVAVNTLHLPYWTGALVFWILALAFVCWSACASGRRLPRISVSLWCLAAVMAGFSVYIMIPVRAVANPPVNEGNPSDIFRVADYLDRRQYAKAPLFYGHTPYSKIMRIEEVSVSERGDSVWSYGMNAMRCRGRDWRPMSAGARIPDRSRFMTDTDRRHNVSVEAEASRPAYVVAGFRTEPVYTPELDMLLPRIYASSPDDIAAYGDWTGMDSASMVRIRISEALDSMGRPVPMRGADGKPVRKEALRPSYLHSFTYLFTYQIGYMYLRYLMWNYAGRQNDVSSTGEIDHGNFITGIPFADDLMLGPQSELPPELGVRNKGHNVYFCVPLLLGLIGLIWLFAASPGGMAVTSMRRVAWISLILFLMTGIAIVAYLNQSPGEPRERDYSFLGSFMTFAFWIAVGMLMVLRLVKAGWTRSLAALFIAVVPLWMLAENVDDHDRSHRSATLGYASNLLESLEEDAILFVDGDNYVFPLWFAQEVMGIRQDVTVICTAYLGCDWYFPQLMTSAPGRDGLVTVATEGDVALGNYNLVRLPGADADSARAIDALRAIYSDRSPIPTFQHRYLVMGRDSADAWTFDLLSIPGKGARSIAGLRELAAVDIIASNAASRYPRPVYWHQSLGANRSFGFRPFTRQALFARRLSPQSPDSAILIDEALDALPLLEWGGLDVSPYPGVDVAAQAAGQRASLIRLAQSLGDAGRHEMALHVARMARVRFPESLVPFTIHGHADSICFEGRLLAYVLRRSGEACGDTVAVCQAADILKADSLRTESFRGYRLAIPAWRRAALSPASRNLSIGR